MAQALDAKTISIPRSPSTGQMENVPALHPRWKETIEFVSYTAPPLNGSDRAAVEEWLERAAFIEDDLHTLLKMPHQKFWCQAVFDETLQHCIDSYLRHAPRSYDIVYMLPAEMKELQDRLHRLFFMTCVRLATHKESKENFITPEVFGDILYENFIFDIPKLMDISVLYGSSNGALLAKMIKNIFTQQPKYEEDLRATVPTITHVLENIMNKCGISVTSTQGSPLKITENTSKNPLKGMSLTEFQDIVFYISDTANTLWAFLDLYPQAAKVFMEGEEFVMRLVTFYEGTVNVISEAMKERSWDDDRDLKKLLKQKLHEGQISLLKTFRQLLFTSCLQPLLETKSEDEMGHLIEEYLHLMSSVLGERRFLAHYNAMYPFSEDQGMLTQSKYTIDETRLAFIHNAVKEASAVYCKRNQRKQNSHNLPDKSSNEEFSAESAHTSASSASLEMTEGACAPTVTGVQLQSMIAGVKDLLPDLGEGFIELCLEELGYDIEKVINCVLEDKLPPSLEGLDKNMPRNEVKVEKETEEIETLMDKRLNVYDNDEFDAFSNKLDMSKVILGKKDKTPKTMSELDQKVNISSVKPLYDKYGSQYVESMYESQVDYDDEYDDTYDSNLIGADDADSADELTNRRPFTIPRILGKGSDTGGGTGEGSGGEESDDGSPENQSKSRDEFIQNPALIRQRQEERRAWKEQRDSKKGPSQRPKQQHDVVGKPKGQGQEQTTVKNRAWKEKHKSSKANHNRRVLADKKRHF